MIAQIIIQIVLLIASVSLTTYLLLGHHYLFGIIVLLVCVACFISLIVTYKKNIKKLIFMLNAIESDDFSYHFDDKKTDNVKEDNLYNAVLNRIKTILEQEKLNAREKERYYELMLDRADTGIMAVDNRHFVHYHNQKVLRLLGIPVLNHLKQLDRVDPALTQTFMLIGENEDQRVSFYNERGKVMLSVNCSKAFINDKEMRILALNNISNELETTENEAWVRLIRVLTHEIMNSISPIASLSESLVTDPVEDADKLKEGLEVINKTSKGLIAFVDSYRSMTHIAKPIKKAISFDELIEGVLILEKEEMSTACLHYDCSVRQEGIMLYVDEGQISQVIVNVIKNAIQAKAKNLWISASIDEQESITIEFANDGQPIAAENKDQIFVPFFTTKPKGSGIGLSLSRQIMQLHEGSIKLVRSNEQETVFALFFK